MCNAFEFNVTYNCHKCEAEDTVELKGVGGTTVMCEFCRSHWTRFYVEYTADGARVIIYPN